MEKQKIQLGAVQETLLIPLWARAEETQKSDPMIEDHKAVEIVDQIDYDFSRLSSVKLTQVAVCIRGAIMDRWTRRYLHHHPQATVVEIGAGLNTRFERVDNGNVRWFDLDLPDSMSLRQHFFKVSERRSFLSGSVLELDWMEAVKAARSDSVLFLAEGVLMYFTEDQVRQLFLQLASEFPDSCLIFDATTDIMTKYQQYHDALHYTSAQFQWGIRNIHDVENWDPRIQVEEHTTYHDTPFFCTKVPWTVRLMMTVEPFRSLFHINRLKFSENPVAF